MTASIYRFSIVALVVGARERDLDVGWAVDAGGSDLDQAIGGSPPARAANGILPHHTWREASETSSLLRQNRGTS